MPFEGRTLREASQLFREHLNRLLSHTITHVPIIVSIDPRTNRIVISFRQGGVPGPVTLRSRFGPLDLYLGQICDGIDGEHERVRLRTVKYQYVLKPVGTTEPLIRWEYDRFTAGSGLWCRHHIQGPIPVDFSPGQPTSLNDVHLPTGQVPIEEVIRFCIVDLDVQPLGTSLRDDGLPEWHYRLMESQLVTQDNETS
jgi:hypothetical protein